MWGMLTDFVQSVALIFFFYSTLLLERRVKELEREVLTLSRRIAKTWGQILKERG